jgi:hypothetical protein
MYTPEGLSDLGRSSPQRTLLVWVSDFCVSLVQHLYAPMCVQCAMHSLRDCTTSYSSITRCHCLQGRQEGAVASALHALVEAGLQLQPADLDSVLSACLDGNQSSSGLTILGYVLPPCSTRTCRCLQRSLAISGSDRLVHCHGRKR